MSRHEIPQAVEKIQPDTLVDAGFDCDLGKPLENSGGAGDKPLVSAQARHFMDEYLPDLCKRVEAIRDRPEAQDLLDWMHEQSSSGDGPLFKLLLQS